MTRWGGLVLYSSVRSSVSSSFIRCVIFYSGGFVRPCALVRLLRLSSCWCARSLCFLISVLASSLADLVVAYSFPRYTLPWPHRSIVCFLLFVGVVACVFGCAWVGSAAAGPAAATGKKEKHHAKAEKAEPTEKTEKSTVQGTRTKHPYETRFVGQRTNTIMV